MTIRTPPDPLTLELVQFLTYDEELKRATKNADEVKANLMAELEAILIQLEESGESDSIYKDDKGSLYYVLPKPVQVGDRFVSVLKREKRTGVSVNEDKLLELAEQKGVRDKVITTIEIVDQEALYTLYAEGLIDEHELDSVLNKTITYAFKPLAE